MGKEVMPIDKPIMRFGDEGIMPTIPSSCVWTQNGIICPGSDWPAHGRGSARGTEKATHLGVF